MLPLMEAGYRKKGWGGRRDSNPQQPESQSGDLPLIYDHHPKSAAKLVSVCGCVKPGSRPSLQAKRNGPFVQAAAAVSGQVKRHVRVANLFQLGGDVLEKIALH